MIADLLLTIQPYASMVYVSILSWH